MAGVNKAIIVGNLGADPEVRSTQSGTQVATFNVATSETYNDSSGQRQERTEWHRIGAFGRLGEICGQYLHKGTIGTPPRSSPGRCRCWVGLGMLPRAMEAISSRPRPVLLRPRVGV